MSVITPGHREILRETGDYRVRDLLNQYFKLAVL